MISLGPVVEMIESGIILAGAGIMGLVLVVCILTRRPAHVPVTVRRRNKKLNRSRS